MAEYESILVMNETELENLASLAHNYKNICLSPRYLIVIYSQRRIEDCCEPYQSINPVIDRTLFSIGLYATIFNANIWTNSKCPTECIMLSNDAIIDRNDARWSIPISLYLANENTVERMLKLTAFY